MVQQWNLSMAEIFWGYVYNSHSTWEWTNVDRALVHNIGYRNKQCFIGLWPQYRRYVYVGQYPVHDESWTRWENCNYYY